MPEDYLTVYHIDPPYEEKPKWFRKVNGVYTDFYDYWGDIVIFPKKYRQDNFYAHLFSPRGDRVNHLSASTYERFVNIPSTVHRFKELSPERFNILKHNLRRLSYPQIKEVSNLICKIIQYHDQHQHNN